MYIFDKEQLEKYVGTDLYKYVIKTSDGKYVSYKYDFEYIIGRMIEDTKADINRINGIYCCTLDKIHEFNHCKKTRGVMLRLRVESVDDIKWANEREILLKRCIVIEEVKE